MPKIYAIQTNFTSGCISPLLEGRIDLEFYSNAARKIENYVVLPTGGCSRAARGGFHFEDETKYHDRRSIIRSFVYSQLQTYQLEIGHQYIRFHKDGYLIKFCRGAERVSNGGFDYDIGYWSNISTGTGTVSYSSGKLRLNGGTSGIGWTQQAISTISGKSYTVTFDVSSNALRIRIGTTSGGDEILTNTSKSTGSHVVTFTATSNTTYLQFNNQNNNNADLDNVSVTEGTELGSNPTFNTDISGYTDLSTGTGSISSSSMMMDVSGGSSGVGWAELSISTTPGSEYCIQFDVFTNEILVRVGSSSGDDDIKSDVTVSPGLNNKVIFTATEDTTYIGFRNPNDNTSSLDNVFVRLWQVYEIESPYTESNLSGIKIIQNSSTAYIFHPDVPTHKLTCFGDINWVLQEVDWIDGPYFDEQSSPTITPSGTTGNITLTASAPLFNPDHVGALWRIRHSSTWGYVKITEFTNSTTVSATVKKTLGGTGASAGHREGMWSKYNGYPSCGTFHNGRLIAGGALYSPQTFCGSKSATELSVNNFENMTPGSLDSDAFYYTVASSHVDIIRWLKSVRHLLIGTMSCEYSVKGGGDYPITPSNIDVNLEDTNGSSSIDGLIIGNSIVFVQNAGKRLIDLSYDWTTDSYSELDITIRAQHLTESGIVEIAYQKEPYPIIWVLTKDGFISGCTFKKSQKIVGWHQHITDGFIESICVTPNEEFKRDIVYAIVRRMIDGETKRYVEYLDPTLNTDSALTYYGTPVSSVSGLLHLKGKTVDIVGNGAVYPQQVVDSSGSVALAGPPASKIEVGLHFDSELETLRPEVPVAGTSQGLPKHWAEVWVRLYESLGCTIGDEFIPFRTSDDPTGEGISPFTGDKKVSKLGWDREARIRIRQTQPLPSVILSIFGTLEVGG